jgi:hypothetical protein
MHVLLGLHVRTAMPNGDRGPRVRPQRDAAREVARAAGKAGSRVKCSRADLVGSKFILVFMCGSRDRARGVYRLTTRATVNVRAGLPTSGLAQEPPELFRTHTALCEGTSGMRLGDCRSTSRLYDKRAWKRSKIDSTRHRAAGVTGGGGGGAAVITSPPVTARSTVSGRHSLREC